MAIIQGEKKFVQQQEKYSLAKKKEFEINIKKNMIKSLESKTTYDCRRKKHDQTKP